LCQATANQYKVVRQLEQLDRQQALQNQLDRQRPQEFRLKVTMKVTLQLLVPMALLWL
jgi:hypothetical protein